MVGQKYEYNIQEAGTEDKFTTTSKKLLSQKTTMFPTVMESDATMAVRLRLLVPTSTPTGVEQQRLVGTEMWVRGEMPQH